MKGFSLTSDFCGLFLLHLVDLYFIYFLELDNKIVKILLTVLLITGISIF